MLGLDGRLWHRFLAGRSGIVVVNTASSSQGAVDLAHAAVAHEAEDAIASPRKDGAGGEAALVAGGGGRSRLSEDRLSGGIQRGEAGRADAPSLSHFPAILALKRGDASAIRCIISETPATLPAGRGRRDS